MGYLRKLRKEESHNKFYGVLSKWGKKLTLLYENRNYDSFTNGEFKALEKLKTLNILTLFDVGANIGDWTQMAHSIYPQANIYAFEVVPGTYNKLKAHSSSLVRTFDFGFSSKEEATQIYSYKNSHELSSLYSYSEHQEKPECIEIQLKRGDAFCEKNGVDRIDFLKIDTEGHDLAVLWGFESKFAEKKIRIVQFEYGRANIVSKALLFDFYNFFEKHNYTVGKIYPKYVEFRDYKFEHEDFIGPNYIAVHKDDAEVLSCLM